MQAGRECGQGEDGDALKRTTEKIRPTISGKDAGQQEI